MRASRTTRIVALVAVVAALLVIGVVAASTTHVIGVGNLMGSGGGADSNPTASSPRVTSIILNVNGSTGDIYVRSASIGKTVTLSVSQSDPNFKTLYDLFLKWQQGDVVAATRTMYLHYTYNDGTTTLYTLNSAYESQLATNATTGIATAVINPQSVIRS